MTTTKESPVNRRAYERFSLPPMYTSVTASRGGSGEPGAEMIGHAYDISEGGMRIELDEPIAVGERLNIAISLPGSGDIAVSGDVVWMNDEQDDPGPRRMALHITEFVGEVDRHRLMQYLGAGYLHRAA